MFWSMKKMLMNQKISLKRRMKLFNSTVSPCVLWCAQSWVPKVEELKKLNVAQRGMLRKMLGTRRVPEEDWVEWICRVTNKALNIAKSCGMKEWPLAHALSKWGWAGHVARSAGKSWVWNVSAWMDADWTAWALQRGGTRPLRPSRRRWMKWEDPLRRFCALEGASSWSTLAADRIAWSGLA